MLCSEEGPSRKEENLIVYATVFYSIHVKDPYNTLIILKIWSPIVLLCTLSMLIVYVHSYNNDNFPINYSEKW